MIGKTLLHYEIVEKLGSGGMGEVYRARDTKLGREVALKILSPETARSPERRKRFQREAMAVAALKHPHIVTIYSVEEAADSVFLTMELVEGEPLDRRIPPHGMNLAQVLEVAVPVVEAVSYAHEKGITHRDLKPANIMLDEVGRPKVLDFGLAKLLESREGPEGTTVAADGSATQEGVVLGTASYMSPEQAEGKPTDPRSDIFSLGILLYEMATGEKPFKGDTAISTISSILKDTPPPVTELNRSLPNHLGRVINRCLAKEPGRRYQVALDLKNELEGLREESSGIGAVTPPARAADGSRRPILIGAGAVIALAIVLGIWQPWAGRESRTPAGEEQVAGDTGAPEAGVERPESVRRRMAVVFPFENLGPAEDAYFAAGVTEEITARLAAVSGLGVISRTSATQYDRSGKTMKQIGEELGVDYVLEGTVRWARSADGVGRVRITPQLVRAADDVHLWSETYDREIDDIFEVQSDIASRVIDEMGVTVLGPERARLQERPTENLEAYEAYLRAIDLYSAAATVTEIDQQAIELLGRATTLDPGFVAAWYRLCSHHANMYRFIDRTEERLSRAREALAGAEAVDPEHPYTHLARGYYYYYGFRDYERALEEFGAASNALPNDAEALRAAAYILRRQGRFEETIEKLQAARELDPRNDEGIGNLASTYRALRRFREAIELYEEALSIDPRNGDAALDLATSHISWKGDLASARAVVDEYPGGNLFFQSLGSYIILSAERDFAGAAEAARRMPEDVPLLRAVRRFLLAVMEVKLEGEEAVRPSFEAVARDIEGQLQSAPSNAVLRGLLSVTYAFLGRGEAAVREAKLAVELTAKDAFNGPQQLEGLAEVYAQIGRKDEALELVERLLAMSYEDPMTIHTLRLDPMWDPLRDHPGYRALLEKHEAALP